MRTERTFALPKRGPIAVAAALGMPVPAVLARIRKIEGRRVIEEQMAAVPLPLFAQMMAESVREPVAPPKEKYTRVRYVIPGSISTPRMEAALERSMMEVP